MPWAVAEAVGLAASLIHAEGRSESSSGGSERACGSRSINGMAEV